MAKDANPRHRWVYTSDSGPDNTIRIYDLDAGLWGPRKIGEITDGIEASDGIYLDAEGTLYSANYKQAHHGGSVTIYPAGSTHPSLTLTQSLDEPIDATADTDGNVYVANLGYNPSIVIFPKGQATPSQVITSSLIHTPNQIVVDGLGNIFFSDQSTGVFEIPSGTTQPVSMNFKGLNFPEGIVLDPSSGMFYVSDYDNKRVYEYSPSGGQPLKTLKPSWCSYFITAGVARGHEFIFAPLCFNDDVAVFASGASQSKASFTLPDAGYVEAIAYKPAGAP
jgi:sugar lactone lactonase YvrE